MASDLGFLKSRSYLPSLKNSEAATSMPISILPVWLLGVCCDLWWSFLIEVCLGFVESFFVGCVDVFV